MDRRDKKKAPRKGMNWSEKHGMWLEADTRPAERREADVRIAAGVEADRTRIKAALRAAKEGNSKPASEVEETAGKLATRLLASLIDARKKAGLSQAEVARRMKVPQPAVVRLESGTHSPTLSTLSRYAAAVGVKLEVRRIT